MIIQKLNKEVKKYDKPENKIDAQQFHKEKLKVRYVLKAPIARKISNNLYKEVKHLPKVELFRLCDELLEKGGGIGRLIAFEWSQKRVNEFTLSDFKIFERWLKKYVNNWGACDHLCCGSLGHLIISFPELVHKTKEWAYSKNLWLRRASAVCLIKPVLNRQLLDEVFKTADILLTDPEDMVQKGYGWMLKVASNRYPDDVFDYVLKNKDKMPRTALRYAIEKMPERRRKIAMKKD
jgi:3-methyladenine DNA glycosylase AlkD